MILIDYASYDKVTLCYYIASMQYLLGGIFLMYEIRPESIKTFITSRDIKLPRFQRKQTWDDKKNFKLCISLFKEYPMGVCILNIDSINSRSSRWLLDGRQRRNALTLMYDNPENIYNWAVKFLGIRHNNQPDEIEEIFKKKISEYLEEEIDTDEDTEVLDQSDDLAIDTEETSEVEISLLQNDVAYGLDLLLEIIKITHNRTRKSTGFSRPFDFLNAVERLKYVEMIDGNQVLSAKK